MSLYVRDVMSRQVCTIAEDDLFKGIIDTLVTNGISGAPVVNSKGDLVGILSEKDLLRRLFPDELEFYQNIECYLTNYGLIAAESKKVFGLTAKDMMRTKVFTIDPDKHIMVAVSIMCANKIRRLPVLVDHKLAGIVSTKDVYRNFLQLMA